MTRDKIDANMKASTYYFYILFVSDRLVLRSMAMTVAANVIAILCIVMLALSLCTSAFLLRTNSAGVAADESQRRGIVSGYNENREEVEAPDEAAAIGKGAAEFKVSATD
jgi:hypothetical protein